MQRECAVIWLFGDATALAHTFLTKDDESDGTLMEARPVTPGRPAKYRFIERLANTKERAGSPRSADNKLCDKLNEELNL